MAAPYDVIVVGAGNAALCAALAAREGGANVVVLEKASEGERGGNTFFSGGGFRFPYEGLDDIRTLIPDLSDEEADGIDVGSYPASAMRSDLMRVTEGLADPGLVNTLLARAYPTVNWMREHAGLRWVLMYGRQAYRVGGKLSFWGGMITEAVGGGEGLSEALFQATLDHGIDVRYDANVVGLLTDEQGGVHGVRVRGEDGFDDVDAGAVGGGDHHHLGQRRDAAAHAVELPAVGIGAADGGQEDGVPRPWFGGQVPVVEKHPFRGAAADEGRRDRPLRHGPAQPMARAAALAPAMRPNTAPETRPVPPG